MVVDPSCVEISTANSLFSKIYYQTKISSFGRLGYNSGKNFNSQEFQLAKEKSFSLRL
jgi:hypothetical protein